MPSPNSGLGLRPAFDIVPQLQANFAFTKAYVAESSGSKGGLGGAKFFVDLSLFKSSPPNWIHASRIVEWRDEGLGLTANFAELGEIERKGHIKGGNPCPLVLIGLPSSIVTFGESQAEVEKLLDEGDSQ